MLVLFGSPGQGARPLWWTNLCIPSAPSLDPRCHLLATRTSQSQHQEHSVCARGTQWSGCCYGNATGGQKCKDKSWEFLHGIGWSGRHGLGGKGGELLRAHLAHLVRNSSDYKPRPDDFLAKSPAAASTTSQGSSKAFLAEIKNINFFDRNIALVKILP